MKRMMLSELPLVSVIIPAYNCARFINETLESVYFQTYKNWEIVVIDDGSTDNNREALSVHMDRIRYFYQRNKGTAAARNAGLGKARGELIAFLDNDDIWLPQKLELQVQAVQRYPDIGLVFTDGKTFDHSGILSESLISEYFERWINRHSRERSIFVKGWLFRELLLKNVIASATSVLVRKRCLEGLGGFDEGIPIADDYDLWLRIARSYPVVFVRASLYMWRYRADSQSGPVSKRLHRWKKASLPVLERNLKLAPADIRASVRAGLSMTYWNCAASYFQNNCFRESRRMLLGCLKHKPFFLPAMLYLLASLFGPSVIDRIRYLKRRSSRINNLFSKYVMTD